MFSHNSWFAQLFTSSVILVLIPYEGSKTRFFKQ